MTEIQTSLVIRAADEGDLGPAMLAILPRQRLFVQALCLQSGMLNFSQAARDAGYKGDAATIPVTASRLAHDAKVIAAIHEEADRRLRSGALIGTNVVLEIATNPAHKDQLRAALSLLDRVGLHAQTEHKVTVHDVSKTDAAMIARIKQLAIGQGLDPEKLLGNKAEPIEADFTPVEDDLFTTLPEEA